jgi:hypothetical protein
MLEIIDVVKECWKENPKACIIELCVSIGIFILLIVVLQQNF